MRTFSLFAICSLVFIFLFAGCLAVKNEEGAIDNVVKVESIAGTIVYRERMMIPPESVIKVTLEDVSKMDTQSEVIAEMTVSTESGPPYSFSLEYDPKSILTNHRYALRARIEANDQLLFTNTSYTPAFESDDDGVVEVLVRRVGGAGSHKVEGKALASLLNTRWKLLQLNDTLPTPSASGKDLYLTMTEEGVHGFSGCNTFRGSFETEGARLSFGPLAGTKMACIDGGDIERSFLSALSTISEYKIVGETLMLLNDNDRTVIICEALYL